MYIIYTFANQYGVLNNFLYLAFYLTAVGNGPASSPALPPQAVSASSPGSPDDGSDESPSTTTAQSPTIPSGAQQKFN